MKITRQSETELVVVDSCLGLAAVMVAGACPFLYIRLTGGPIGVLLGAGFLLLCAFICLQKSTFVFDGNRRMITWKVLHYFKTSSGSTPFDAITGITIDSMSNRSGGDSYRLSLLTSQDPIPMAAAYGGGRAIYEDLRGEILNFLQHNGVALGAASRDKEESVEASVESLLKQGRKIDAIKLLRNSRDIGLAEATDAVAEIEQGLALKRD